MAIQDELKALGFRNASYLMNCGIYVLLYKGEVMYVGSTVNPLRRIGVHRDNIEYDQVYFVKCNVDQLEHIEGMMIAKLRPRLNVDMNPDVYGGRTMAIKIGGMMLRLKKKDGPWLYDYDAPPEKTEYFTMPRVKKQQPPVKFKRRF